MFFVYILQRSKDGSIYVGQTNNLEDRVKRHNSSRSVYTKAKIPWKLIYFEKFENRSLALSREKDIKKWKSSSMIKELIECPD